MKTKKISISFILTLLFLILFTVTLFVLIFWGFFTSLKSVGEFRSNYLGLPKEWSINNYIFFIENCRYEVIIDGLNQNVGLEEQIYNTLMFCVGCSLVQTLIPCICAYGVTKFKYFFGKIIYSIVLITMMLPIIGSTPSELYLLHRLGLEDTFLGVWILKANFLGMYFLIFCASFKGVPASFSESAFLDGASEMQVMFRINFPMVKNTMLTIFLLLFISYWNDYQTVLLYLPSHPTISYGLYQVNGGGVNVLNYTPLKMTGVFIVMIPTLVLFSIFGGKMMGNLSLGGLKE